MSVTRLSPAAAHAGRRAELEHLLQRRQRSATSMLGIEQRVLPGGVELIGHLGGTAGYRSFVGRLRPQEVTISFVLNWQADPTPLVLPVVQALAAARP